MILYFSGTGNTRFVAEMLADLLEDQAVNIMDLDGVKIGKGRKEYDFSEVQIHSEKPLIIMSPLYAAAPASVVCSFATQARFEGNKNVYFLLTCVGVMSGAYEYCEFAAKKNGLNYMGTTAFSMPQNYIVYFKTVERDECEGKIQEAIPKIQAVAEIIKKGEAIPTPKAKGLKKFGTDLILLPYEKFFMKTEAFYTTSECIGCGKCERVCPLQNVKLEDKKPVWGQNCTHCMACINYCPVKAIEYGEKTKGKPRYTCRVYK